MSTLPEIKHDDTLEISVNVLPRLSDFDYPMFTYLGNKWIFHLIRENHPWPLYYSAYFIMDPNSNGTFKAFSFLYQIEMKRGTDHIYQCRGLSENVVNSEHRFWKVPCYTLDTKPFSTLDTTPFSTLDTTPFSTLDTTPFSTLDTTPFSTLDTTPFSTLDTKQLNSTSYGPKTLKFSFTFILESEPVLKLESKLEDKSTQTGSYANTDVSTQSPFKDFSELWYCADQDAKIKCGEHSFRAHKAVLCERSEVFKAMLQSDFLEGRTGVVEIEDMDNATLLDFIKYIYTDQLPELTPEKAMTLYQAGDKYDLRSLMMRCSEYLQDNLSTENALLYFVLADAHSDENLKSKAMTCILQNKLYQQSEYWLPFCENYPKLAIEVYKLLHE